MGQVFVRASRRARAYVRGGNGDSGFKMTMRTFNRAYRPRVPQTDIHSQMRASNIKRLKRTRMPVSMRRSFKSAILFTKS